MPGILACGRNYADENQSTGKHRSLSYTNTPSLLYRSYYAIVPEYRPPHRFTCFKRPVSNQTRRPSSPSQAQGKSPRRFKGRARRRRPQSTSSGPPHAYPSLTHLFSRAALVPHGAFCLEYPHRQGPLSQANSVSLSPQTPSPIRPVTGDGGVPRGGEMGSFRGRMVPAEWALGLRGVPLILADGCE